MSKLKSVNGIPVVDSYVPAARRNKIISIRKLTWKDEVRIAIANGLERLARFIKG